MTTLQKGGARVRARREMNLGSPTSIRPRDAAIQRTEMVGMREERHGKILIGITARSLELLQTPQSIHHQHSTQPIFAPVPS